MCGCRSCSIGTCLVANVALDHGFAMSWRAGLTPSAKPRAQRSDRPVVLTDPSHSSAMGSGATPGFLPQIHTPGKQTRRPLSTVRRTDDGGTPTHHDRESLRHRFQSQTLPLARVRSGVRPSHSMASTNSLIEVCRVLCVVSCVYSICASLC